MPTKCILTEQGGKGTGEGLTLIGLEVTQPPSKQNYIAGDSFERAGMEVTATYGVGTTVIATGVVEGYGVSPDPLTDGTTEVTVTYTEMGSTCTAKTTVRVKHRLDSISVTHPPDKVTYKYQETFNPAGMQITATYSDKKQEIKESGAFSCSPLTPFSTLGQQNITVSYTEEGHEAHTTYNEITVEKADGHLEVSPMQVAIDSGNLRPLLTVTRLGDGAITYSPDSISGITSITMEGDNIRLTGDGNTAIESATLTINVGEGEFYTAPPSVQVTITAEYWKWGDDNAKVDADWFKGLQNYLKTHKGTELEAVGKIKTVTLDSPVLGTTEHKIVVIGADQDADNTLTFQTLNCLKESTKFSDLDTGSQYYQRGGNWRDSNCVARKKCEEYYQHFPGKDSILTVKKGTCPNTNDSKSGQAVYNDETVWLPSEEEMGLNSYSALTKDHSSITNAECAQGKKFSYTYYESDSRRIKQDGDSGGSNRYYWERSRYYSSGGAHAVCAVYGDGTADYGYYWVTFWLAPAFVIGNPQQ